MLARLTVYQPDRPGRRNSLARHRDYLVGRDAACAIHIGDDSVSRRHAKLVFKGDSWRLTDLCSKNGTYLDGRAIRECGLGDPSWIEFGTVPALFERVSPEHVAAEQRQVTERWTTSVELSSNLQASLGLGQLLRRSLDTFVDLAEADRGFILLGGIGGEPRTVVARPSGADFHGSRSVVERTLAEMRPIACSDVRLDSSLRTQASIADGGISALACVPLRVGSEALGVLYVDSRQAGKQFTEPEIDILRALADHAALVIGVSRLRENLIDLSGMLPPKLDPARPPDKSLIDELRRHLAKLRQPGGATAGALMSAGEGI